MTAFAFTKMHGLGNDFIVIDNLQNQVELNAEMIRQLSDRHTGIGFDQLLIVEAPSVADAEFDYLIYNADGDEVEHCGNGARCFARYVSERHLTDSKSIRVNTQNGVITLELQANGEVTVLMGIPDFNPDTIPFIADQEADFYNIEVADETLQVGAVSIGNPHVVIQVADVKLAEVERIGPLMEQHQRFPNRVNVGFMQILDRQHLALRVFERGVGETRACGTGACAAVAVAHKQGLLDNSAVVSLPGGDLQLFWQNRNTSIEMTGPCSTVFDGHIRM